MDFRFGLEWDHELEDGIFSSIQSDSIIEIIPENFFDGRFAQSLDRLASAAVPVSVHGVLLSIGTIDELDSTHLDRVLEVAKRVPMVSFSEHLALTKVGEIDLSALTPLAWNREVADVVCKKVERIQSKLDVPFYLENVANRFVVPSNQWSETQFINYITEKTGCGLLLDLHNVYVNSVNFSFDPYQWLADINLDSVKLIHLAGGYKDPEHFLMDSHDNDVPEQAWDLYRYVMQRINAVDTIIERTSNFPHFSVLENELSKARQLMEDTYPVRWSAASADRNSALVHA